MNQGDCLWSPKGISSCSTYSLLIWKRGAETMVAAFVDVLNRDNDSEYWLEGVVGVYWMNVWWNCKWNSILIKGEVHLRENQSQIYIDNDAHWAISAQKRGFGVITDFLPKCQLACSVQ